METTPNTWRMPIAINLDSRGLRHSSRPSVSNRRDKVYSNATQMTQDELLPAGLGLRSANSFLPAGLGLRSANSPLPAGLGLRSAKSPNLSVGFGVRSVSWKNLVAALALFSSIYSHGHRYSSSLQETIPDVVHSTFSKAINSFH
jgi:hypothetical protein